MKEMILLLQQNGHVNIIIINFFLMLVINVKWNFDRYECRLFMDINFTPKPIGVSVIYIIIELNKNKI